MRNKNGLQLTINFLVMFILSMAMFATGLMIVYQMFRSADDIEEKIIKRIKSELRDRLTDNKLAISTETINRGEFTIYHMGISHSHPSTDEFYIITECDFAVDNKNSVLCDDDSGWSCNAYDNWVIDNPKGPLQILKYSKKIFEIPVAIPKTAVIGTYEFDVRVCEDIACSNQYLQTQRLTVLVK